MTFHCPACGGPTRCKHTYRLDDGGTKRRRRCTNCGLMITTRERLATDTTLQGRDYLGRYVCLPEAVPLGYVAPVPECSKCHHLWGGRCQLNHAEPATCRSFLSHRRAAELAAA